MRFIVSTIIILSIIILVGGFLLYQHNQNEQQTQRQKMIHQAGSHVMPFSLDKTTHTFEKTTTGGIETVVAKNTKDRTQIQLIQMHLQMESEKFKKGDFSDPASLHGENMPGLQTVKQGAPFITFTYATLSDGASITYTSSKSSLIDAIHTWFDAQVSDHGHDAMGSSMKSITWKKSCKSTRLMV